LVEVPEGERVEPRGILLTNLSVMTYRGTLSFTPQEVLKDTLLARWKRKTRKWIISQLVSLTDSNGNCEEEEVWVIEEEGDRYPIAQVGF
jgi:hypothetical protein